MLKTSTGCGWGTISGEQVHGRVAEELVVSDSEEWARPEKGVAAPWPGGGGACRRGSGGAR